MSHQASLFEGIGLTPILKKEEPVIEKDEFPTELLEKMKHYIKIGVLFKTDEFYKVVPEEYRIEETCEMQLSFFSHDLQKKGKKLEEGTYQDLIFLIDSTSYRIYKLYMDKKEDLTKEDILGLDIEQMAKDNFISRLEADGVAAAIEYFQILKRPKYHPFARSTKPEELEETRGIITQFVKLKKSYDMEDKMFNFIRASKKKKTDDPACFDGNCLEKNIINGKIAIFGREVE